VDNNLTWSAEVYDLFGLPRDALLSRQEIVGLYAEDSRAAMERLRAYAIKHRRGFTLDAEIRTTGGHRRWMRLTAAPMCTGGRVVRLYGLKQDVSHEYL
jgi:PAS domain S-box-containing protein